MAVIRVNEEWGNVDWNRMKETATDYVMLRAGYGGGVIDVQFRKNAQSCNDMGIPFGVYWLSYALTPKMAEEEARHCMETIEEYRVCGPVQMEFDESSARYVRSKGGVVTPEFVVSLKKSFQRKVQETGLKKS
ncbi:MAG: GH25 family lysozyme [Lachnoclostridium sp.]|nr:GH25 family lysozyme [Lachnoclostridium sp.]